MLPYVEPEQCDNEDAGDPKECHGTIFVTSHCSRSSLRIADGTQQHEVHWDCATTQQMGGGEEIPESVLPLTQAIRELFNAQPTVRNAPQKFCGYR